MEFGEMGFGVMGFSEMRFRQDGIRKNVPKYWRYTRGINTFNTVYDKQRFWIAMIHC